MKSPFLLAFMIFSLALLGSCNKRSEIQNRAITQEGFSSAKVVQEPTPAPQEPNSSWLYHESVDKMRNEKTFFASIGSKNKAYFKFPYQGGSTLRISLSKRGEGKKETSIIFLISKGQFASSSVSYNKYYISAKFDNNKIETFSCEGISGGTAMYVSDWKKFLKKIKNSKTLTLEFFFYHEGSAQFEFDLSGLKWD